MVKTKLYKIIWSNAGKDQLKEIFKYIKKDSLHAAEHVKSKILESTRSLETGITIYQADVLKDNNNGSYRAYTIFSYRITYKIEKDFVYILRVRHTSREPLEY